MFFRKTRKLKQEVKWLRKEKEELEQENRIIDDNLDNRNRLVGKTIANLAKVLLGLCNNQDILIKKNGEVYAGFLEEEKVEKEQLAIDVLVKTRHLCHFLVRKVYLSG